MNDMAQAIIPKSDQLNADDLLAGPMTIKITGVAIRGGQEQPVAVSFEGDNGKPYKACKSMCRVMVTAWGADSAQYIGRSLTLYCDPKVKWAGMEVGGIRISHMSDIDSSMTMALTATKGSRKPFTVRPLVIAKAASKTVATTDPDAPCVTPEQVESMGDLLAEKNIAQAKLLAAAEKVTGAVYLHLNQLPADFYARATGWIEKQPKPEQEPEQERAPVISDAQKKRLEARIGELKLDRERIKRCCKDMFGKDHFADLTPDEYSQLDAEIDVGTFGDGRT